MFIKPKFIGIPKPKQNNNFIDNATKEFAKSKEHFVVVHGARAMNKHLPKQYHRPTKDWDLWAKNPDKAQDKYEDLLDKLVGSDMFYEEDITISYAGKTGKAKFGKVCAVKSKLTREAVAEFVKLPKGAGYKMVSGIKWETLKHMKKIHKAILEDPSVYKERKQKSLRDLKRIELFERSLKR